MNTRFGFLLLTCCTVILAAEEAIHIRNAVDAKYEDDKLISASIKKKIDRPKLPKLELSLAEVNSKTDSELYELFYDNEKVRDQWIEDQYRSVVNKMDKPDISDEELKLLFSQRDRLEKKRQKIEEARKKKAWKVRFYFNQLPLGMHKHSNIFSSLLNG